ncbi:Polyamine-transporting ATPase 13A3 [Halotydeus destructor]|nr:Polyamine-transporting ATPase 13A3 [Halotydeus destructor]
MKAMNDGTTQSPKSRKVGPPPLKPNVDYVNAMEEDQMEIYGFKRHWFRNILTWCAIVLTLGGMRIVFHWRPHWMLLCSHIKCSLKEAEKVMLVDQYCQIFVENVTELRLNGNAKPLTTGNDVESNRVAKESPLKHLVKPLADGHFEEVDKLVYFQSKQVRYLWDDRSKLFSRIDGLDNNLECSFYHEVDGLTAAQQDERRILYGSNEIKVEVQSIVQILFNEVLGPFYVFQVFSIILWCLENYIYYASCIVIMSSLSLISSVVQIRRNQTQLRDTVEGISKVTVYRGHDVYEEIDSTLLVPGDIIAIPPLGCIMQCDAIVISGNVIVNESMLTGESVPITKTPLPDIKHRSEHYNSKEHARHTLFCGTKVIQTRYYDGAKVEAVVIRTGFLTAKGELVRSIMFPKPVDFKFNQHIYKFIKYLTCLAAIGFTYTVIIKIQRDSPVSDILIKALDLVTIIIPPALPMAMTVGVIFAQTRLKKSNIFCISPRSINISGCINCVCFDKTGTLTEDDLSFTEVVPVNDKTNTYEAAVQDLETYEVNPLTTCLAACHSLTIIDGNIIGDPLDQKMFDATGWSLEEPAVDDTSKYDLLAPTVVRPPKSQDAAFSSINDLTGDNDNDVGILRQFQFSSSLQRMSVVTKTLKGPSFMVYSKGAPEVIATLCDAETLPDNFSEVLMEYTQKGFRVLALAYRQLSQMSYAKMQRATREDIEKDLNFLGLLVMGNMLKPETTEVIDTLTRADIRTIMVTGDNMLTAISVARECHMVGADHKVVLLDTLAADKDSDTPPRLTWNYADQIKRKESLSSENVKLFIDKSSGGEPLHVAVTGKTFHVLREHYPDLLNKVAIRGTVFSRMAPEQKQQLVELLQDLGYYVAMCGDGANDCGALKAAHAGVSLSETEASVASPFTSKTPNISCIPILIREGRTALVTAFGILKYMACYSICQFTSVIILYTLYTNLTDMQYLYEDLFLISLFCVLFGRTESFKNLSKKPPPSSLIGLTPLISLVLQILLILSFQLMAVIFLQRQPWYRVHVPTNDEDYACHDNYAVFAVSVFQFITLAVVFSKGAPYRKAIFTNVTFTLSLVVMTVFTIYLVVLPHQWLIDAFQFGMDDVTMVFRYLLVGLAAINFVLAMLSESFIVDYLVFAKAKEWFKTKSSSKLPYDRIYNETQSLNWLPSPSYMSTSVMRETLNSKAERLELTKKNGYVSLDGANEVDKFQSRSSPTESGIYISSPASDPITPGDVSVDVHNTQDYKHFIENDSIEKDSRHPNAIETVA